MAPPGPKVWGMRGDGTGSGSNGTVMALPGVRGSGRRCPICGRPSVVEVRPFCSRRCRDVDLNRWLGEGYRVPGREIEDGGDGEAAEPGIDERSRLDKPPGGGL